LGQLDERGRLGVKEAAEGRGRSRQKRLFDDVQPRWVEVDACRVRVENCRDFGGPWLGLELVRRLGWQEFLRQTIPQGREKLPWSSMALEEVDRIAAIDGVDMLFLGPADMSQALGCIGQVGHEKVWEAVASISAACRRHGKPWGTVPAGPDYAARCVELGCRMLTLANETLALRRGVEVLKECYAEFF
jgi:hypothetical protein